MGLYAAGSRSSRRFLRPALHRSCHRAFQLLALAIAAAGLLFGTRLQAASATISSGLQSVTRSLRYLPGAVVRTNCVRTVLFVFITTACAVPGKTAETYPVVDSRFAANESQVFWLDNARVKFSGFEPGSYPTPGGRFSLKGGVYVWNTGDGSVRQIPEGMGRFCYDAGYVSYIKPDPKNPGEFLHYSGKFGEEQPSRFVKRRRNNFSCRYYDTDPPGVPPDRQVRLLHDDHGYLDLGLPRGQGWSLLNAPVTFHPRGSRAPVRLPFGQREFNTLRYSPFNESYLFYGGYIDAGGVDNNWPPGRAQPVWVLGVDGKVSEIRVPPGPWNSSGSTAYFLTRKGVFIQSHNFASLKDSGHGGGYLYDGTAVRKVVSGRVHGTHVSPDGCRVAFVYGTDFESAMAGFTAMQKGGAPTQTVRALDLCAGDKR